MRTASYIGFWAMIALGVFAFAWADKWWLTVVLILAALAVGWCSLGLYGRAATAAAQRARNFEASGDDEDLLGELGRGRAHEEAFRRAREHD